MSYDADPDSDVSCGYGSGYFPYSSSNHFEPPRLHCEAPQLLNVFFGLDVGSGSGSSFSLLIGSRSGFQKWRGSGYGFQNDADLDPASKNDVDPNLVSKNDADPDPASKNYAVPGSGSTVQHCPQQ